MSRTSMVSRKGAQPAPRLLYLMDGCHSYFAGGRGHISPLHYFPLFLSHVQFLCCVKTSLRALVLTDGWAGSVKPCFMYPGDTAVLAARQTRRNRKK